MQEQDVPLAALFERAWTSYEDADAEQSKDAIRWLQAAVVRVSAASVLSLNEEVDDIPTADLKYLLLPYMQGYLLSDSRERDAHKRLEVMQEAGSHLTRFLQNVQHYKVLSKEQEATLGVISASVQRIDAATRRAQKIQRFQLVKAIKAELDGLKMQDVRSSRLRRMQHEDGEAAQSQGVDEDSERETWLNQIALASLRAADRLSSIQQELGVLRHAVSLPEDERAKPAPVQAPPPELMASLQQAAAALRLGQAEQMRAAVFRPSHILPTVTLAEQAEREMAAAGRASEAQARADAARAAAKAADKDGEQETLRQRAWDDWKDNNPRGAGNSKLRPTA
ncbi:hypothetical protein CVIRNUC_010192 [Coccomyxa viridis]|uniref:Uncharacterized protein n=1 Tax=Coccomyxa viridis TaxID=1274662 RepID=A0AAV1II20_9CHLO|nr:hypothetical protein CVIRNUC_010192 [Coccomyxa viridis]